MRYMYNFFLNLSYCYSSGCRRASLSKLVCAHKRINSVWFLMLRKRFAGWSHVTTKIYHFFCSHAI